MIDFSYPLRALVGQIQHAHSYAKSIETAHFGRIYTDGFNLGYSFIYEPIIKPALDFARNHKVATSIVGTVFVLAYLGHRTRPEIDSGNKRVNGDEGDGSGTDTEGAESEGEGKRTRKADEAGTKTPEGDRSEEEGDKASGAASKTAAAKPLDGDKSEEEEDGVSGPSRKNAPDAPPPSGDDRKEGGADAAKDTADGKGDAKPPAGAPAAASPKGDAVKPKTQ